MTDPANYPECTSYPSMSPFVPDPNRRIPGHYFPQDPFTPTEPLVAPRPATLQRVKNTTQPQDSVFNLEDKAARDKEKRAKKPSMPRPALARSSRR
jgi:hypothetical protein